MTCESEARDSFMLRLQTTGDQVAKCVGGD